jgi:hypothetical protein
VNRARGDREHLLRLHGVGGHSVVVHGRNVVALTMNGPSTRDSGRCGTERNTAQTGVSRNTGYVARTMALTKNSSKLSAVCEKTMQPARGFAGWRGGGGLGRRWLGCVFDASAEQSTSQKIGEGGRSVGEARLSLSNSGRQRQPKGKETELTQMSTSGRGRDCWALGRGVY